MRIAFDARMEGSERADWWRALTDALPDDDWLDPAVEGTQSARWREADIAVVANPLPGRLAGCTQLKLRLENGTDAGWIDITELEKAAKKEGK